MEFCLELEQLSLQYVTAINVLCLNKYARIRGWPDHDKLMVLLSSKEKRVTLVMFITVVIKTKSKFTVAKVIAKLIVILQVS